MKQEVLLGQTDYTVLVLIRDDAGAPKTGLTEASVDIAYARVETDNDVTTADVTPAALSALTDAHTDWGFEEVSATDHPGLYRLDIADAVFASGAWSAVVSIVGTGLDPTSIEFVLVNFDPKATTLPSGSITATAIATGAIDADAIADNAIDAGAIAADAITAAKIADGAIDAATFAAGAINAAAIANGAIDAATFAADVDAEFLSYLVDDATRIDASALNTASVTTIPAILTDTDEIGAAGAGLTALATQTSVNTIDDLLDTEIGAIKTDTAAIKVQTDKLTFTVANQVDANIQSVNDVTVNGTGAGGDEWGP
jgi:hypothetical protein